MSLAVGDPVPSYQWYRTVFELADVIPDATNATLHIEPLGFADSARYFVVASNLLGVVTSEVAQVQVLALPLITRQPDSQHLVTGSPALFTVLATGEGPFTYQWYFNGANLLAGETAAELHLPAVGPSQAGRYRVVVGNLVGEVSSEEAVLAVGERVSVAQQPVSVAAPRAGMASFSVVASGEPPFTYQWFFGDAVPVAGATGPSLTLSNLSLSEAGDYTVVVANFAGSQTSQVARLEVLDPPGFLVQPASRTGIVGATITLTAEAEGTPPLFLQWFREGGLAVPGATSAQLELVSVQSLDGGGYYLEVSNRVGRIRSDTAQVDVISPPQLSGIGGARAVALGGVLHLTALVDGTPPFEFVWLDEDAEIPGQTGAELILTGLTFDQAGAYRVRVTNPAGVALSSPVSVAVLQAPVITIPPRPQVIAVGDTLTLTALAEGAEPLEYRWMFNTNTPIPSATGPVLVLENIQPSQQGTYQFVVSNAVGVAVSPHVRVRVQEPPVILSQPADQTVPRGTTAHFQVQATGTGPLRFSWFFNELQLVEDATNALLTLSNVSSNQAGSYQVVAQNEVGSVTSQVARLVVKEVPLILTQPVGTTVVQGGEAQFSVLAVGPGVLRYQWMFAGIFALPDQTNATLVLSEVQPGLAGDYSVEVSNDEGSVSSSLAHLIVVVPPSITQQPEDRLAPVGGHAEFTVRAIGSAPLTVQWFFNETLAISGGTNGTLRLENLTPVESGPYFAVVSNVAGSITSRLASLSVLAPPVITQPPLPQRTVVGQPATFQVGAEGAEPLAFRWLHNGLELPGDVTQRVLQLPAVSAADSGSYAVRVSNAVGAVTSAPVTLTLLTPPFVTLPQTEDYRPVGGDFELEAEVGGTAPFTFQWLFFATNVLADATNAVLQLHDLAEAQSGIYQVVVANEAGVVTSTEFVLNVVQPPTVVAPPADLAVVEGETAVFQVEAAGYEPLSYQWLGPDAAPLPGATSPVLQLSNVTPSDAGHYSVQVSNRVGMVMSTSAELVVLMTPRFVVQPQGRTVARGGTGQFAVQATGTEPIYYQWFYEGNVPLDHQTNTILALDSVELAQAGQYFVRASNVAGVAMSEVAVLTVLEPPTIVRHPASLSVAQGQPATFRVLAEGAEPLSYQWFRDGAIELPGAVSSELILTEAQVEMAGDYSVRVSNPVGTILSEAARLGVVVPPAIVTSPTNVFSPVGGRAEFHVSVTGSEPLAFQWVYQATNALPDATNRSLVLTDLRAEQSGPYSVVVANAAGAVRSEEANLSVKEPPRILSHPASQRLLVGETARFEVVAAGDETLHYRWFGPNAAPLPGATLPVLEVPEVTGLQAGEYWVEVSNEVGVAISDAARLEVDSPPILVAEPLDLLAARGGNAQLEVQAAGAQPLTYQWLLFETNVLTDATNSVLAWEHVDYTNAGRYRVSVANPFGVTISREVEVQVLERPSVITLSSDLSVIAGQPARFVVEAGGDGPFSYQWFREGSGPIADATESSLTLPGVMPADAGRYFVEVSNPVGSVQSQRATLEVWVPPTVIVPPQDLVLPVGAAASFQVTAGGTEPVFYQWFLNGATVLVDQTNRSLLLPPVALEDAGIYSVSVSNQAGVLLSSAQLRVLEPPTIRSSPGSLVVATGAVVRLEVQAGGSEPLTYQWYADGGIPIPGATQPVLLIESAGVPDAGRYSVEVGNEVGVVSSLPATLQVLVPPYLRSEPSDLTVMSESDAELSAEVGGDPELHLQWYFFASNAIPDAITSTLRLLAVSVADSGDYVLTVSNAVGGIVSRTVRLTVLDPPLIGTIPLSLTLAQGEDARFEVLASGSALHYQWFKDGTTQIPGATGPVLLLPQVQLTDVGSYSVVISNAVGLAASPAASLRVLVPANILSFSNDEGVAAISFFSYKSLRYTLENADGLFGPWRVSSGSLRRKGTDGVITLYDVPPPSSRNRYFRILVE